ncbi:MAG: TolB family protein [Deltaproteobacteria bacterium]|nr:TolB family protein [Deltaproteobacteria bacterium]
MKIPFLSSLPSLPALTAAALVTAPVLTACEPLELTAQNIQDSRGRVLFTTDRDGQSEIYSVNEQGTDLRRLTNDPLEDVKPCWASLHSRVAFVRGAELFTMMADGTDVKQLTAGKGRVDEPACTFDGLGITFSRLADDNYDIWRIDANGQGEVRLTTDPATDDAPAWSPDGQRIAFLSDRTGTSQIFLMQADGSNVTQITFEGEHGAPAWSIDNRIVMWREDHPSVPASFVVVDPDGKNEVTIGIGAFGDNPTWAPDGKSFLYEQRDEGGTMDVYRYDLTTATKSRFILGAKAWNASPSWQVK